MNKPSYEQLLLWVTGRAASGKSTFARLAQEECRKAALDTLSLCDEKLMLQIIEEDEAHEHHYHPYDDERFLFKSNYPFDEGIRRISSRLQELLQEKPKQPLVTIVELARGRCSGIMNFTFERALQLIDPEVVRHSHFFYLHSDWEQQLARNRARERDGQPHPPDFIMRELYSEDDFYLAAGQINFEIVENHGDVAALEADVRFRIQRIIAPLMPKQGMKLMATEERQ